MIAPPAMRGRFGAPTILSSNLFGFAFGPMRQPLAVAVSTSDEVRL